MSTSLRVATSLVTLLASTQLFAQTAPPPPATGAPQAYPPQQPAAYPPQQPAAYPQQQPAAYPQQQPGAYPQQQPGAYPPPADPNQPGAYPQQQPGAYPQQQPGAYPQQQPGAYPQQQPGAYPPPGDPNQAAYGQQGYPPPPPPAVKKPLEGMAFVPRLGLVMPSSGEGETSCDGSGCEAAGLLEGEGDYDLTYGFAVGAELLFSLSPLIRIGPSLILGLGIEAETEDADGDDDTADFGMIGNLNFVFELTPQVSPTVWLTPRAQLGLAMYNATGDAADFEDDMKEGCEDAGGVDGCESYTGPHLGWGFGLGMGAMFSVSPSIRLRGDLMWNYYSISTFSLSSSDLDVDDYSNTVSGSQIMLLGGIEL